VTNPPRFVYVVAFLAIIGLMLAGFIANYFAEQRCAQQNQDRAMWLWLADYALEPDGSNADKIADLLAELDIRIPACEE
jgi:hypothetical protein